MSNLYSGDPSASDLDWVRFRIGDVASPWKFSDAEINATVTEAGSKRAGAAACCRVLAARASDQVDYTNMALSESASQRAAAWMQMALDIIAEPGELGAVQPQVGGIYQDDRDNQITDISRTMPSMTVGMNDRPGSYNSPLADRYRRPW